MTATRTPTAAPTPTPSATPSPIPTSTPTPVPGGFPAAPVLDPFTRANGALGSNWSGTTGGYAIATNRVDVGNGGDIYWSPTSFGANQEVYITLATIDTSGVEIDLLLKAQSRTSWNAGEIEVLYNPVTHVVQVWTFTTAQNWVQRGANIPVTFANGDVFGARATAAGQVQVYRNGTLLGTRDVTTTPAWPFAASSGYIGLWFDRASASFIDNFGGGTSP
jgi:hypothetical protein